MAEPTDESAVRAWLACPTAYAAHHAALAAPRLLDELARLRALNESLCERIAAASEVIGRRAERDAMYQG